MKTLLIGASGQLGRSIFQVLNSSKCEILTPVVSELNITDSSSIKEYFRLNVPKLVINVAGFTDVNLAERLRADALVSNAIGPKYLAQECRTANARFMHFSTDYVFSGKYLSPINIFEKKTPSNFYGYSKSRGEDEITKEYPNNSYIFRTAWLFSPYRKNFVKTMVKKALSKEKVIRVVNDQTGQPTSAKDLAQHLIKCLDGNLMPGIYHSTNSGEATWFDFAREIFKLVGEDPERILPISSSTLVEQAPRPSYSVLSQKCWENTGIEPMRNWQVSLEEQIEEIKAAVVSEGINGN